MSDSYKEVKFNQYMFDYWHENTKWVIEIPAKSREDAIARLKKLPLAQYRGEVHMSFPASSTFPARIIGRITTWWLNATRKNA